MHQRNIIKAPASPAPQGRAEQSGRGTRADWRQEGAAGEPKKGWGLDHE
ncbi:MAG: hypothetical protein K8R08_09600 [Methanosarcinales archaeon]|nr:hypothetical protein [Methanosarcinales archaeon]